MGRCGGDLEGGRLRALLHPPPLLLIDRGRVLKKNLQSELLTLSDLLQQLREQGVDDVAQVKRCLSGIGRENERDPTEQPDTGEPRPRRDRTRRRREDPALHGVWHSTQDMTRSIMPPRSTPGGG